MKRHQLIPDAIYARQSTGRASFSDVPAFVTPDGIGLYHYDSVADAVEQHGEGTVYVLVPSVFDRLCAE